MDIPVFSELNCTTCSGKYIKKHYTEFYDMLSEMYLDADSFGEKLYRYFNKIDERPVCLNCGSRVPFLSITKGFQKTCSVKCSVNTEEYKNAQKKRNESRTQEEKESIRKKVRETNLKRYGVDNPSKSEEVKNKIRNTLSEKYGGVGFGSKVIFDKAKDTNLERYGDEYANRTHKVREKIHNTNIERYGGTGFASEELKEKCKQTLIEKYGESNVNKITPIKEKINNSVRNRTLKNDSNILDILYDENGNKLFKVKCSNPNCTLCNEKYFITFAGIYGNRKANKLDVCTTSNPLNTISRTNIELFIRNLLDKYNIEYETNRRDIIDGKELDIYIPSKNIAIECNGVFWHDSAHKPKLYHFNKYNACREKNIQLITLWEDQILKYPEKVESLILSKLGVYDTRLYARECVVGQVSSEEVRTFLDKYHLQGSVNSKINYGLYYKNELVSVMAFGKTRNIYKGNKNENEFELYRYCCKAGYQIVSGAERLLKHFIRDYNPSKIISFASNDISSGDLYCKLGFEKDSEQKYSYWYINHKTCERFHRYTFTKKKLVNEGYDSSLTEEQIMYSKGFLKIYDTGTTRFTYTIK